MVERGRLPATSEQTTQSRFGALARHGYSTVGMILNGKYLTRFFPRADAACGKVFHPDRQSAEGIASACSSGIKQPAATGQAIILSFSVADDVVASISPEKAAKSCGGKAPGIRRHCLTDSPDAFDFAVEHGRTMLPAASIHSSGREYHEPEGDADRYAAPPAAGAG